MESIEASQKDPCTMVPDHEIQTSIHKKTRRNSNAQSKSESILSKRQGRHACLIHHSHQAKFFRCHQAILNPKPSGLIIHKVTAYYVTSHISQPSEKVHYAPPLNMITSAWHAACHPCSSDTILSSLQVSAHAPCRQPMYHQLRSSSRF